MTSAALSPSTVLLGLLTLALFALGVAALAQPSSEGSRRQAKHRPRNLILGYVCVSAAFSALFLTLFSALGAPSVPQMLPLALALGLATLVFTTILARVQRFMSHAVYGDPSDPPWRDKHFLARLTPSNKSTLALAAAISGSLFALGFYFILGSSLPSTPRLFSSIGAGVGGSVLGYATTLNYLHLRSK
jgi:hypothetical protein